MIRQGTVPTITTDELEKILEILDLEVVKKRNTKENLGYRASYLLGLAINRFILTKSETEDD